MDTLRMRHVGWVLAICCLTFLLTACVAVETTTTSVTVTAPGKTLLTLHSPSAKNDIYAVAWSPNGRYIAYGGSDTLVYVWVDSRGPWPLPLMVIWLMSGAWPGRPMAGGWLLLPGIIRCRCGMLQLDAIC